MSQQTKAEVFKQLHNNDDLFILPNPWDAGSAKLLTSLGFKALATTSAGYAFSQGKLDSIGTVSRDEALAHARDIVNATHLPVSADLENGYGDAPDEVANTINAAASVGLVGCTIEDTTEDSDNPIYEKDFAVQRIKAAVKAAKALPFNFTLTARAENFLHGRPDLHDTIERLKLFEQAGADVLYAPGLPDLDAVEAVCKAVTKPVNVVAGIGLQSVSVEDMQARGVSRISTGSSLARVAIGALLAASVGIRDEGRFSSLSDAASFAHIETLLKEANSLVMSQPS